MRCSHLSPLAGNLSTAFAGCAFALLAAFTATDSLGAQVRQAAYPLITDLLDTTATYGPMTLIGNPNPPSPPANGLCFNGIYRYNTNGQDARTPVISSLTETDFQIEVEFSLAALPPSYQAAVLMGGSGYRWIGIYVQANGTIGLKYNNSLYTWSNTTVSAGRWYAAVIKFELGNVELFLDGRLIHAASIGALTTGANLNFCSNDYSNGTAHNGCLRNLVISNDATLGLGAVATALSFGDGCDGLVMAANGLPTFGNYAFTLDLSNVPVVSPLVFAAFGFASVNPGTDLTAIGMPGCFQYSSLDIGLMGPSVVFGGVGIVALPIPSLTNLQGMMLTAQGISLSAANRLGLAASNGVQLTLGY